MPHFYITSNEDLKKISELACEKKIVALDTEFTREKTYYPILSLIQVAIGDKIFLIDCLEQIDLKPIYDIISSEKIKKILHSSAQDLQIFYQQSGSMVRNVVDVQLMANFCGFVFNSGYSGLVEKLFAVTVDKKMQCSDWQHRPLHKQQLEYAMNDVFYLERIYEELAQILQQKKRQEWFEEEIRNFVQKTVTRDDNVLFKNFSVQKRFGRKNVTQIAKIRNLILWREKMAQQHNVPRRHFLDDEAIEEIAMLNKFHEKLDEKMRAEVIEILERCDSGNFELVIEERKNIMDEEQKGKYQKAKDMVAKIAVNEDLREQFLLTSYDLKEMILGNKKFDDLIFGWRYYLFGEDLKKIINF